MIPIRTDGAGLTGGTQGEVTGTERRELLGQRGEPEQLWIGAAGAAGPAARKGRNIYEMIYVS